MCLWKWKEFENVDIGASCKPKKKKYWSVHRLLLCIKQTYIHTQSMLKPMKVVHNKWVLFTCEKIEGKKIKKKRNEKNE